MFILSIPRWKWIGASLLLIAFSVIDPKLGAGALFAFGLLGAFLLIDEKEMKWTEKINVLLIIVVVVGFSMTSGWALFMVGLSSITIGVIAEKKSLT